MSSREAGRNQPGGDTDKIDDGAGDGRSGEQAAREVPDHRPRRDPGVATHPSCDQRPAGVGRIAQSQQDGEATAAITARIRPVSTMSSRLPISFLGVVLSVIGPWP